MAIASHASPPLVPADSGVTLQRAPARERWSWALYDFANTIFSMNVATLYFAVWLVSDLHASNFAVGVGNAVASVLVAISIPLLGAISDARGRRKPWVIGFTIAACAATALIGVLGQTMLPLAGDLVVGGTLLPAEWHLTGAPLAWLLLAFILANYAYQGALPFYNAMLPDLVPVHEQGRMSGIGTGLGYLGSLLGMAMVLPFFSGMLPPNIALSPRVMHVLRMIPFTSHGGRVSAFVPTALLFLVFSLPLFFFCRDHHPSRERTPIRWREGFRDLAQTLRDTKEHPGALRFILASFLYQDAMGTIISYMALYAVEAMGFQKGSEVTLFLVLTLPSIVGSFVWGSLVDRIGAKRSLVIVIASWVVLLLAMVLVPSRAAFWVVGSLMGFVFGGVATAERPLMLSLIPEREAGRFFGLMVLSARAAAVLGPLVWGIAVDGFTPHFGKGFAYRAAVVTVDVAMALALVILAGVPDRRRQRA